MRNHNSQSASHGAGLGGLAAAAIYISEKKLKRLTTASYDVPDAVRARIQRSGICGDAHSVGARAVACGWPGKNPNKTACALQAGVLDIGRISTAARLPWILRSSLPDEVKTTRRLLVLSGGGEYNFLSCPVFGTDTGNQPGSNQLPEYRQLADVFGSSKFRNRRGSTAGGLAAPWIPELW